MKWDCRYCKMQKLLKYVEEFIEENEITNVEDIYKLDSEGRDLGQLRGSEFIEQCCEVIGYKG